MVAKVFKKLVDCTKFYKEIPTLPAIEWGFGWVFCVLFFSLN